VSLPRLDRLALTCNDDRVRRRNAAKDGHTDGRIAGVMIGLRR
jgi:hypothetical protein